MYINNRWYTETEVKAYVDKLIDENAALKEENSVILHETDRLIKEKGKLIEKNEKLKKLLKAAVEDINYYVDCYEAHCDECCCDHDNHCHWKHADEALKLIGGNDNA